ncbi:MAG: hypothetical protein ACK5TM_15100 [Methylobacterium sp.]
MTFLSEANGLAPSGFGPGPQNGQEVQNGKEVQNRQEIRNRQEILSQVTPCEAPARPHNAIPISNRPVGHANGG